jgi:hypothetical protein
MPLPELTTVLQMPFAHSSLWHIVGRWHALPVGSVGVHVPVVVQ